MKKFVLSLSILLLLALALPMLAGCSDREDSGKYITDFFGIERPEKCFGTECLVLPEYPDLAWLFGSDGESGYVSEAALEQSGKLKNGTTGYIVCLLYASSEQEMSRVTFDLTYCSGTQILYGGEGLEIGEAEGIGSFDAELDMTGSADERLQVSSAYAGYDNPHNIMQGAIIIPISFAEGSLGTLYVELSIEGEDMVNPQRETTETVQVGVDNAKASANIYGVSVGYLKQGDYNNGKYEQSAIQASPTFTSGEACYMVLDLSFRAVGENDGSGSINVLTYMPDRGAMSVTIEEAPTGKVHEVTQNNVTSIYASFAVPPEPKESKVVRMLIRLLPISGGVVDLDIYFTGGVGTALEGQTHVALSLQTGTPALNYTLNEDKKGYTVTGLADAALTTVNIPDVLGDGLPVTGIAPGLFQGNTTIREVVVGGIAVLEEYTFCDCTALESVTIGKGVLEIQDNAFVGCNAITSIRFNAAACADGDYSSRVFPSNIKAHVIIGRDVKRVPAFLFDRADILSVTFEEGGACESIGRRAFAYCEGLQSLEIPYGRIGEEAFRDCTGLRSLTLGENVSYIENKVFSGCTQLSDIYYNAAQLFFVNGVSEFGSYEQANHYIFENVGKDTNGVTLKIGTAVTTLPGALFHGMNYGSMPGPKLTTVVFEADGCCEAIGNHAFYGQELLTYIQLPEGVEEIGESAFAFSGLTMMVLPNSVKLIGREAFLSCMSLETFVTGDGVEQIAHRAFVQCTALKSVSLGQSLESIGAEAFYCCDKSLEDVFFAGDLAAWCRVYLGDMYANPVYYGGKLYLKGVELCGDIVIPDDVGSLKYHFYGMDGITSVTIGEGVGRINERTFYDCDGITSVRIGADVTYIGNSAFAGCGSLSTVHYDGTTQDWVTKVTAERTCFINTSVTRVICTNGNVTL